MLNDVMEILGNLLVEPVISREKVNSRTLKLSKKGNIHNYTLSIARDFMPSFRT